jgi:hypothetical protein
MIVFDRGYNDCHQAAQWSSQEIFFVTRLKKSTVDSVVEVNRKHYRKKDQTKKACSVVAALVRMQLIRMLDVNELLRSTNRTYQLARGSPDGAMQLELFSTNMGGRSI